MPLITSVGQLGSANSVSTTAVATTGANLLIVAVSWYSGTLPDGTLTDSASNTWTPLTTKILPVNVSHRLFYCYAPTTSASHTFTYTGTNTFPSIAVQAWSGASASPFGAETGAVSPPGDTVTTIQPGSLTPTQDNMLVVSGLLIEQSAATFSVGGGFTSTTPVPSISGSGVGVGLAYLQQTTAAAANPTWTASEGCTAGLGATLATFKMGAASSSDMSGGATLDNLSAAGTMSSAPASGTITGSPLVNNTGTLLTSAAVEAFVNNATTGTLIVKKTGITSHATTAVPTFSDAAVAAGTPVRVVWRTTSDGAEGLETLTPT